jgi:hypothetical protein
VRCESISILKNMWLQKKVGSTLRQAQGIPFDRTSA